MGVPGGVRRVVAVLLAAGWLSGAIADVPRIAVIIDDLGYLAVNDHDVLSLDRRIGVAIIPDGPLAPELSRRAADQQRDILIHLPLSGVNHDNCEFAATCVDPEWSPARMADHLRWAVGRVDRAVGINNHQGSRFTSDDEAVRRLVAGITLLERIDGVDLFVVDSRTTPRSRLKKQARQAGLATARRHVFLDHDRSPEAIESAWQQLLDQARQRGFAIAIGHPHRQTIEFLGQAVEKLGQEDVELVPVSRLLRPRKTPEPIKHAEQGLPLTLP